MPASEPLSRSTSGLAGLNIRISLFALLFLFSIAFFFTRLIAWFKLGIHDERCFHTLLIPCISGALVVLKRQRVSFSGPYKPAIGLAVVTAGTLLAIAGELPLQPFVSGGQLQLQIAALILVWVGIVITCFGLKIIRGLAFPIALLVLMIPPPSAVLDGIAVGLQTGSAEVSYRAFQFIGVPVFRDGFRFSLPGLDVVIATQCSGIHSALALFIFVIVASNLFLRSNIKRLLLCTLVVPIVMFTNGARIVSLSWLAMYVDKSFLVGGLHRYGGYIWGSFALAILMAILSLLRVSELPSYGQARREELCSS